MSFDPHPFIPVTREQAAQRDARHTLDSPARLETAADELNRLRLAIAKHRAAVNAGEPQRDADEALWSHIQ